MAPSVDVVVPTFNARDIVSRCVEHLVDPSIAKVIVVDDASSDDTASHVAELPRVEVVRLTRQRGLAHAFNQGASRGAAPYLLFLNNDIFAAPGAVERLVELLEADDTAGSAAGRLVDPDTGETQISYSPRAIPGAAALVVRLVGIERYWPSNPVTGQHRRRPLPDDRQTRTSRQPAGACLLVRRADHVAMGGWDERYWIWYEDVDYSRRLLDRGPALYEPGAVFRHVGGASTGHWDKAEQHRRLYHGTLHYAEHHLSRAAQTVVGVTAVGVSIPRIVRFARRDPRAAAVYRSVLDNGVRLCRGRPLQSARPD